METAKLNYFGQLDPSLRGGARFAWLIWVVCAQSLPGCLVTNDWEFPIEESLPPAVVGKVGADYRLGDRIGWSRRTGRPTLRFEVSIWDPNVQEKLWARWRVSDNTGQFGPESRMLSPCLNTGEDKEEIQITLAVEREFGFNINRSEIEQDGCFRLELAVSGSFTNNCTTVNRDNIGVFKVTDQTNDVGIATWWLLVGDDRSVEPECHIEEVGEDEMAVQ